MARALQGSAALILFVALCGGRARGEEPIRIIAHRGGVVDSSRPENSVAALEEAIQRKYWMVEMDVMESKDGRVIVHHDDFQRSFGVPRHPRDLTWEEIAKLRAREDGSRVLEFAEYAPLVKSRTRLMVDVKGPDHPRAYYEALEKVLRDNRMLETAYMISDRPEPRAYFKGKVRVSVDRSELKRAVDAGEEVSKLYFLFEHGTTLDAAGIDLARRAGVPVVVSINEFHYAGRDHMKAAHDDIVRLRTLGLIDFQIDSIYDQWLR
jgi:glycerophosphoryl diester phosphodiesterase